MHANAADTCPGTDLGAELLARVQHALAERTPLHIHGGGTKAFYGRPVEGAPLDTRGHRGIVSYDPTELVITARAGTPLAELEAALDAADQMLACEPPHFGPGATVGGMVAAGLSGPRRPWVGSVRDFVLGCRVITGAGKHLRFGGEVMKNVAGYDVSRLVAGSLGTLGILLEVSLKVLPRPLDEATLRFELDEASALRRLNEWGGQPLPVSASLWSEGVLHLRLSGAEAAVRAAIARLGGEVLDEAGSSALWTAVREQSATTFALTADEVLWRLSLPSTAPALELPGRQTVEWGGALRWLASTGDAAPIRARAAQLGGHAAAFRGGDRKGEVFQPLSAPLATVHRRLKQAFDPAGIFNPGRLYPEF